MLSLMNEALLSTKHIQHAAIIRKKDNVVKAKTSLLITVFDVERITKAFENPKETRQSDAGVIFADIPYKAVRCDNFAIYAKNSDSNCGIIIGKTVNHYIVGTYDSTMLSSVAAEAVEKLAEYFRKKNK